MLLAADLLVAGAFGLMMVACWLVPQLDICERLLLAYCMLLAAALLVAGAVGLILVAGWLVPPLVICERLLVAD